MRDDLYLIASVKVITNKYSLQISSLRNILYLSLVSVIFFSPAFSEILNVKYALILEWWTKCYAHDKLASVLYFKT